MPSNRFEQNFRRDICKSLYRITNVRNPGPQVRPFAKYRFRIYRRIHIRGSTKVGKKSIDTIANTCKHLHKLNLNFTSAPPPSIAYLTGECLDLEVLKLAGINGIVGIVRLHLDTIHY